MKIVKEHIISEKFTEDSDPIHDLGIGYSELVKIWIKERNRIGRQSTELTFREYFPKDKTTNEKYRSIIIMIIYYAFNDLIGSHSSTEHQQIFNKAVKHATQSYPTSVKGFGLSKLKKKAAYILNTRFDTRIILNEKFTEDSDPIHDLGIGMISIYKNLKKGDVLLLKKDLNTNKIYLKGYYILIVDIYTSEVYLQGLTPTYDKKFSFLKFNNKEQLLSYYKDKSIKSQIDVQQWYMNFKNFKNWFEYIPESKLNEKFIEDSDPIHDMGIGIITWDTLKNGDILRVKKDTLQNRAHPINSYLKILKIKHKSNNNISFSYFNYEDKEHLLKKHHHNDSTWVMGKKFFEDFLEIVQSWELSESELNEKFIEDSDPIHDMGIGITKELIEKMISKIFKIDSRVSYVPSHTKHNVDDIDISLTGNFITIGFYSDKYYDKGKEINKKEYAKKLIKLSGLDSIIDKTKRISMEPPLSQFRNDSRYSPWLYTFKIKEQYHKVLRELDSRYDYKDF